MWQPVVLDCSGEGPLEKLFGGITLGSAEEPWGHSAWWGEISVRNPLQRFRAETLVSLSFVSLQEIRGQRREVFGGCFGGILGFSSLLIKKKAIHVPSEQNRGIRKNDNNSDNIIFFCLYVCLTSLHQ